eukprot:TRINITY_DN542_c0_g1_i4.p1 TRINITY_DN542_c0_g1~~TRINITY_DN542_c0_g1_i4.p1  ORF type:complete len:446 (-),score=64.18 TRINITY_DN542_c0_g1_i4:151-1428(-)
MARSKSRSDSRSPSRSRSRSRRRESRDRRSVSSSPRHRDRKRSRRDSRSRSRSRRRHDSRIRDDSRAGRRRDDSRERRRDFDRTRDRGRGSRGAGYFLTKAEVDDLFLSALKEVFDKDRDRVRLPINASVINDRMRNINRNYHANNSDYARFSDILLTFENQKLIRCEKRGHTVLITWCKYGGDPYPSPSRAGRLEDAIGRGRKAFKSGKDRPNVYFCGSIRGGREEASLYKTIIDHVQDKYGQVLTAHVGDPDVKADKNMTEEAIFKRDLAWMNETDIAVADVTVPSLGVGYELCHLSYKKVPTLCLFNCIKAAEASLSAMIRGDAHLKVHDYNDEDDALAAIDKFFDARLPKRRSRSRSRSRSRGRYAPSPSISPVRSERSSRHSGKKKRDSRSRSPVSERSRSGSRVRANGKDKSRSRSSSR